MGEGHIPKYKSAQKVDPGEEKNSATPAGKPRPFDHESGTLTIELSP